MGETIFYTLPKEIQDFITYHFEEYTELFQSVFGALTDLKELKAIMEQDLKMEITFQQAGWAWHFLHMDF